MEIQKDIIMNYYVAEGLYNRYKIKKAEKATKSLFKKNPNDHYALRNHYEDEVAKHEIEIDQRAKKIEKLNKKLDNLYAKTGPINAIRRAYNEASLEHNDSKKGSHEYKRDLAKKHADYHNERYITTYTSYLAGRHQ